MPGIIFKLGSFPNSQIKPTSAVRDSNVTQVAIAQDPAETKILNADPDRITATIYNSGAVPWKYDYRAGQASAEGLPINPGGSITVEGSDVEVWATAIGGAGLCNIDDRKG